MTIFQRRGGRMVQGLGCRNVWLAHEMNATSASHASIRTPSSLSPASAFPSAWLYRYFAMRTYTYREPHVRTCISCVVAVFHTPFRRTHIHMYAHTCTHSFVHSFIHAFIHSLIRSLIRSFIHSSIHSFIHSFILTRCLTLCFLFFPLSHSPTSFPSLVGRSAVRLASLPLRAPARTIGVGVNANGTPFSSLCNYKIITPQKLIYLFGPLDYAR